MDGGSCKSVFSRGKTPRQPGQGKTMSPRRRTAASLPLPLLLLVGACLLASAAASGIGCIGDSGRAVSWFAMLKFPKGGSYVYADVNSPTFAVSPGGDVGSKTEGAMAKTIQQVRAACLCLPGFSNRLSLSRFVSSLSVFVFPNRPNSNFSSTHFWFIHSFFLASALSSSSDFYLHHISASFGLSLTLLHIHF